MMVDNVLIYRKLDGFAITLMCMVFKQDPQQAEIY